MNQQTPRASLPDCGRWLGAGGTSRLDGLDSGRRRLDGNRDSHTIAGDDHCAVTVDGDHRVDDVLTAMHVDVEVAALRTGRHGRHEFTRTVADPAPELIGPHVVAFDGG